MFDDEYVDLRVVIFGCQLANTCTVTSISFTLVLFFLDLVQYYNAPFLTPPIKLWLVQPFLQLRKQHNSKHDTHS